MATDLFTNPQEGFSSLVRNNVEEVYILSALSSWGEAYFLIWVGLLVIRSFFSGNILSTDTSFFWYSTGTAKEKKKHRCQGVSEHSNFSLLWGVWKATSKIHEYVTACLSSSCLAKQLPDSTNHCLLSFPILHVLFILTALSPPRESTLRSEHRLSTEHAPTESRTRRRRPPVGFDVKLFTLGLLTAESRILISCSSLCLGLEFQWGLLMQMSRDIIRYCIMNYIKRYIQSLQYKGKKIYGTSGFKFLMIWRVYKSNSSDFHKVQNCHVISGVSMRRVLSTDYGDCQTTS